MHLVVRVLVLSCAVGCPLSGHYSLGSHSLCSLVPRPRNWAWYQPTRACANFTLEYWRKRIWWRTNWAESIDYTSSVLYHYQLFIFAKFQRTGKVFPVSFGEISTASVAKRTKASSAKVVSPETSRCRLPTRVKVAEKRLEFDGAWKQILLPNPVGSHTKTSLPL